jgi:hypothetical protein
VLQCRAAGGDVTGSINIEDGRAFGSYTTHGFDATGRRRVVVAGQANNSMCG